MISNISAGWLEDADNVIPSPNCNDRINPDDISLIVVHCISLPPGEFGGEWIDRLFTNTLPADAHPYFGGIHHLRVAAHVLIRRDGAVTQYVPFHRRAFHAGISSYCGRETCNDFSIGIELEGTETIEYTQAQYDRLAAVIQTLLAHYPTLSREAITGHCDIAPGRKTDPGPSFDWGRLFCLLDEKMDDAKLGGTGGGIQNEDGKR
ncbi:MAG: 1,6-anhydro-N-acetylmuramyl-L-alanine amidase AmpD [Candidatus Methylumidiphilus sp.]